MYRKIQTSSGKRKFYHQTIQNQTKMHTQNNIIRPPTSHPYSGLNNNRFSSQGKHKYDSNYFKQKILPQRRDLADKGYIRSQFKQFQVQRLPKHFKHWFGQLKVIKKNNFQDENTFQSIIRLISQKIVQMESHISLLSRENMEKQGKIEIILKTNEQLLKKIKQVQDSALHKKTQKGNTKKMQFEMMLENIKLSQINQNYLNTIKQLSSKKQQDKKIEITTQNQESQYSTEVLRFHNRINYLQMKLKNSQTIQNNLLSKSQAYMFQIQQLMEQNQILKQKNNQLSQNRNQWRERAIMQKQDAQTNYTRQNFLLFSIKKLRESNKSLMDKLINVGSSSDNKKTKEIQTNPYFQYEVDFFKSIKTIYYDAKFKQYKISLQNKNQNIQISPLALQKDYIQYRKLQQVNLASLSYFKPTFYSFIQESATSDIYSCRVKGNTSVSRIFIQVLRSLFNCKINQFMILSQETKYTRFPQFVYSWFQKFYFNSQKNIITALQPYMQKPISQDVFYRDLMNVKLDQSWEIITFRQFLLEQLNLQQLYFYLMCQNLLYKKAGITQQVQYFGEFCILAEYSAAKSVLDLVLSDFQSWNISFLASKLRQKVIVKKNIEYIECGFFLRCLVEYYKIERSNRYKYICKLCDEFKSCQENGLRFSSFISVINRFTQISVQQKIRVYRNCYSVSRGKITADVIYTVCSEELIFLRYLKLKCFYQIPTLIKHKQYKKGSRKAYQTNQNEQVTQQIICVQPSYSYIYDIFIGLNRLVKNEETYSKRVESLGVIQLLSSMVNLKKMFSNKAGSQDCSVLKCKHFIHYINETMQKIRQISYQNFYQLLDQNNKKKSNSTFWIQIDQLQLCEIFTGEIKATFQTFEKINEFKTWKSKVYNFRVNNAAKKIQKQVRKKFIQPFMQLYKIIYSELKKTDAEEKIN